MKGISVIIPAYNSRRHIAEAIQSVINQKYDGPIEILISDDGSTDGTIEIAETFNNKVKIIRKPKNCLKQGVSSTRNRALNLATQPYISFLDSDDFYLPNHLNHMISILENNPNFGFSFCRTLEVKFENGKKLFRPWTHQHISKNDIQNPGVSRNNIVHTNCFLFRRVVFDKVGKFNEAYSNAEDGDQWMRISEQFKGIFSNHYGCVYRINHDAKQLTKNNKEEISKCHFAIYKNAIKRYYQLRLNDRNRIFELKHLFIHNRYRNNLFIYSLNYAGLICKYPIPFLKRFSLHYYKIKHKENSIEWSELNHFLNI